VDKRSAKHTNTQAHKHKHKHTKQQIKHKK